MMLPPYSYLWDRVRHLLYLAFFVGPAGCGLIPPQPGKWVNPSKTEDEIKLDHYSCAKQAWEQYPLKMGYVSAENGYWASARNATSECSYSKYTKKTYCTYSPETPGHWVDSDIVKGDENAKGRSEAYVTCMSSLDATYKCMKNGSSVHGSWCGR